MLWLNVTKADCLGGFGPPSGQRWGLDGHGGVSIKRAVTDADRKNFYGFINFCFSLARSGGLTRPMCGAQTCTHLHPMNLQHAHLERVANTSEKSKEKKKKAPVYLFCLSCKLQTEALVCFPRRSLACLDIFSFTLEIHTRCGDILCPNRLPHFGFGTIRDCIFWIAFPCFLIF